MVKGVQGARCCLLLAGLVTQLVGVLPAHADHAADLPAAATAVQGPAWSDGLDERSARNGPLRLRWSGYLQAQYQRDQQSHDELAPGGTPLNQDRFVVRRARLRATASWELASEHAAEAVVEYDGNTVRGISAGVRRAQIGWRWRSAAEAEPWLAVTGGLTSIPFGDELRVGPDQLPFFERSAASLAWFPGSTDTGLRVHGALGWFRYDVAATSGVPFDERLAPTAIDPTAAPDLLGRLGFAAEPARGLHVSGGASYLAGTGLSPGSDASKARVIWKDYNDNGQLDSGESVALPAQIARASTTYKRWAVGLDLRATLQSGLGTTQLWLEGALANNLDRGQFVADPVLTGRDQRGVGGLVGLVHELPLGLFVGLRASVYRPDLDQLDSRRGLLQPVAARYDAISPLLGLRWHDDLRLALQYDHIADRLGRDAAGEPTDLRNDRWTLRAQARF